MDFQEKRKGEDLCYSSGFWIHLKGQSSPLKGPLCMDKKSGTQKKTEEMACVLHSCISANSQWVCLKFVQLMVLNT